MCIDIDVPPCIIKRCQGQENQQALTATCMVATEEGVP